MNITVIIPIYNSAKTVEECIRSILDGVGNIDEILLINNGSTDNSAEICREWVVKCQNIKYYEIDHANVCDARNYGIQMATSKYIAFVDSDDTINNEMYSRMYQVAESNSNDLVFCKYNIVRSGVVTPIVEDNLAELVVGKKLEYLFHAHGNVMGSIWRSLFRNDLLKDIRFDNRINITEDRVFALHAIASALQPNVIDYYGYNYNVSELSTRKYARSGYHLSLLHAHDCNNKILADYSSELVEYNSFATYEYIMKFVVYTDKYDRAKIKSLLSSEAWALNTKKSYKAYVIHQSKLQKTKAFLFRHKLHWLLYFIAKIKSDS